MLRNCWNCLMGSDRVDNEVYGTILNGQTINLSSRWPQPKDEIMFRLPKPIEVEDQIEITGNIESSLQRLSLSLITGTDRPDYNNIACQFEACFQTENNDEEIILSRTVNGNKDHIDPIINFKPSELFPDPTFTFTFKIRIEDSHVIDIVVGAADIGSVEIQHNLHDIQFLILNNEEEKLKVTDLKFSFK